MISVPQVVLKPGSLSISEGIECHASWSDDTRALHRQFVRQSPESYRPGIKRSIGRTFIYMSCVGGIPYDRPEH